MNPGYFIDSLSNQPWYRCLQCKYDCFMVDSIKNHVQYSHSPLQLSETEGSIDDWKSSISATISSLRGLKVGISLLTWNTLEPSRAAALEIKREYHRLIDLGLRCSLFWADNGSTDGTVEALRDIFETVLESGSMFASNIGQSKARNDIRNAVIRAKCDYWLMVDGDIEIVPYSSFAMLRFLQDNPVDIGCVGMYCRNCTHVRDQDVAKSCRKIDRWMVDGEPEIAWTNYGLFRKTAFANCRFDEEGPFAGPGWGFEDDDYSMQMAQFGLHSVNTKYFRHMHRRRHSSLKMLDARAAALTHRLRRDYLLEKWKNYPQMASRLAIVANHTMPELEY